MNIAEKAAQVAAKKFPDLTDAQHRAIGTAFEKFWKFPNASPGDEEIAMNFFNLTQINPRLFAPAPSADQVAQHLLKQAGDVLPDQRLGIVRKAKAMSADERIAAVGDAKIEKPDPRKVRTDHLSDAPAPKKYPTITRTSSDDEVIDFLAWKMGEPNIRSWLPSRLREHIQYARKNAPLEKVEQPPSIAAAEKLRGRPLTPGERLTLHRQQQAAKQ
jgi:hypothetical protein